jgi:hypothetical protein
MKKFLPALAFFILIFSLANSDVLGFPSSSTNFKLEGEFNIFGGSKSSANFKLTDTGAGTIGFGPGSSSNYRGCSGFQCVLQKPPSITFSISSNSINLGALSSGAVSSQSHTISVTTSLTYGYQATVLEDGELRDGANNIDNAGLDDDVDAGAEEYGLATSRTGQQIVNWDGACNGSNPEAASEITTSPQTVASATTDVTSHQTTLCYSASISPTTPAGVYSQTLTYVATGTF